MVNRKLFLDFEVFPNCMDFCLHLKGPLLTWRCGESSSLSLSLCLFSFVHCGVSGFWGVCKWIEGEAFLLPTSTGIWILTCFKYRLVFFSAGCHFATPTSELTLQEDAITDSFSYSTCLFSFSEPYFHGFFWFWQHVVGSMPISIDNNYIPQIYQLDISLVIVGGYMIPTAFSWFTSATV